MNWDRYDVVVGGAGLTGALLVDALSGKGHKVLWVDPSEPHTATKAGAGIINPISGRKFSLAHQYYTNLEVALELYRDLEKRSGTSLIKSFSILKAFPDVASENSWLLRMGEPPFDSFMSLPHFNIQDLPWRNVDNAGMIHPVFRVDMQGVSRSVAALWGEPLLGRMTGPGSIFLENEQLEVPKDLPVIHCLGHQINDIANPQIDLKPYKGEALIIHSEDLPSDFILHHRVHIIPYDHYLFWVGASNSWDYATIGPTPEGRVEIESALKQSFDIQYEIRQHIAGVRPSATRRRPLAGPFSDRPNTWFLNGLGTKGALLAPRQVHDFLLANTLLG
jgi:glycine/D-amino acid oxidase-like deaminating enzyme